MMPQFFRELIFPLTRHQHKKISFLFLYQILNMILVTAGVGVILPILAIVAEDDIYGKYPVVKPFLILLGSPDRLHLLLFAVLLFFLLIFLKVGLTTFILAKRAKLTGEIRATVSTRLFRENINRPYSFHVEENSAKVLRSLTSDVAGHGRCLISTLDIMAESLVVLALLALLGFVDLLGILLIAGLAFISGLFFFRILDPLIVSWGKRFREEAGEILQHAQQAMGGIKEIKILSREEEFAELFSQSMKRMVKFDKNYSIAQAIPPNWFELITALGILLLVVGAVAQKTDINQVVPILGVFSAAALRLMPSLAKIVGAVQTFRYNRPAMQALYARLRENEYLTQDCDNQSEPTELEEKWSKLEITDLSFCYKGSAKPALIGVNLTVQRCTSVGIIGESGSGKSTLMDLILALNNKYTGDISIDGVKLDRVRRSWQAQIGYVPQHIYLIDDSLKRNIAFGIKDEEIDMSAVRRAIDLAQLSSFIDSLELGIETVVGERGAKISGGQQQRIGIARALYRNPSVLVLDEATSSLDHQTEQEVMKAVDAMHGDKTMIIISHRLSTVENCDHLLRLNHGKVVAHDGAYGGVTKNVKKKN